MSRPDSEEAKAAAEELAALIRRHAGAGGEPLQRVDLRFFRREPDRDLARRAGDAAALVLSGDFRSRHDRAGGEANPDGPLFPLGVRAELAVGERVIALERHPLDPRRGGGGEPVLAAAITAAAQAAVPIALHGEEQTWARLEPDGRGRLVSGRVPTEEARRRLRERGWEAASEGTLAHAARIPGSLWAVIFLPILLPVLLAVKLIRLLTWRELGVSIRSLILGADHRLELSDGEGGFTVRYAPDVASPEARASLQAEGPLLALFAAPAALHRSRRDLPDRLYAVAGGALHAVPHDAANPLGARGGTKHQALRLEDATPLLEAALLGAS